MKSSKSNNSIGLVNLPVCRGYMNDARLEYRSAKLHLARLMKLRRAGVNPKHAIGRALSYCKRAKRELIYWCNIVAVGLYGVQAGSDARLEDIRYIIKNKAGIELERFSDYQTATKALSAYPLTGYYLDFNVAAVEHYKAGMLTSHQAC